MSLMRASIQDYHALSHTADPPNSRPIGLLFHANTPTNPFTRFAANHAAASPRLTPHPFPPHPFLWRPFNTRERDIAGRGAYYPFESCSRANALGLRSCLMTGSRDAVLLYKAAASLLTQRHISHRRAQLTTILFVFFFFGQTLTHPSTLHHVPYANITTGTTFIFHFPEQPL
jgi:hypothetical protein